MAAQAYTPDFSISLTDFQAKATQPKEEVWVLDFWATWCGPCIQAVPHMKELHQTYADKGVRFISLSWDKKEINWREGLDRLQMPWNHILIPKTADEWFNKYFPHKGIPTAFVINHQGKIKKVNDVYVLDKAIDKALAQ